MQIASIQLNSQNHLDDNLAIINTAIRSAKTQGASLVVLPENACLMGRQSDIANQFDELAVFFGQLAKQHTINLIAGTLPCPYDKDGNHLNNGKFFQTSLAFNDQGACIARYDKIHLFRATVADGVGGYDESLTFMAGDTPTLADFVLDGQTIKVGMMVCFDLRFPKLAQLYRQLGADILVAPSAFTFQTGQANWQTLLQARALDSQCFMVGSAQGGTHRTKNSERTTWGHSLITNASGQVISTTNTSTVNETGFAIVMARFDKAEQARIRQNLPIFNCHRLA